MVNLNKQRIGVYVYLFAVLTLISGLSFNAQGDKITGYLIFESASNIKSSIYEFGIQNILNLMFMFLMSLVVVFFVLRYMQEVRNTITPENTRFYGAIITVMLIVSFFSVGFYSADSNKITGAVGGLESITGNAESEIKYDDGIETIGSALKPFLNYFNMDVGDVKVGDTKYTVTRTYDKDSKTYSYEVEDENGKKIDVGSGTYLTALKKRGYGTESEYTYNNKKETAFFYNGDAHRINEKGVIQQDKTIGPETYEYYEAAKNIYYQTVEVDGITYAQYETTVDVIDKETSETKKEKVNRYVIEYESDKEDNKNPVTVYGRQKFNPENYKESSGDEDYKDIKKINRAFLSKKQIDENLGPLIRSIYNKYLGPIANERIKEMCEDDYESSEPASDEPVHATGGGDVFGSSITALTPLSGSSSPDIDISSLESQEVLSTCIGDETTITAQGVKIVGAEGFEYGTSFTILTCKDRMQYGVFLSNSKEDRVRIALGYAEVGIPVSETNLYGYIYSYNQICVLTSNVEIGEQGEVCFDIVSNELNQALIQ